jgi:hypothetical protein
MEKHRTAPLQIPRKKEKMNKVQYSSCLTKLYGISPDLKISPEVYMKWCTEQQEDIDDFFMRRDAEKKDSDKEAVVGLPTGTKRPSTH